MLFVASTHGRAERTVELLHDYEVRALLATQGRRACRRRRARRRRPAVARASGCPTAALQVYAETDVFEEERRRTTTSRKRSLAATFLSDLRDLKVGDYIVHVDHGIGQFVGLKQLSIGQGDIVQEFLELRYHGDDKMFVPVERLDLIQKYTGGTPSLDRLGGTSWEKAKKKVKKAMRDMAEELLKLYAARRAVQGHAFQADTHWQEEFEGAFEWDLTPDQVHRHRRHQARHGVADADGPPALRRRRLRQDRGGDAGRVQGGDGRQAGRGARAQRRCSPFSISKR